MKRMCHCKNKTEQKQKNKLKTKICMQHGAMENKNMIALT
jgi:hypothetical protein